MGWEEITTRKAEFEERVSYKTSCILITLAVVMVTYTGVNRATFAMKV